MHHHPLPGIFRVRAYLHRSDKWKLQDSAAMLLTKGIWAFPTYINSANIA
jgi:hypothetical protein